MGLTIYQPALHAPDEAVRARAVDASGALDAINDADLHALADEARHSLRTGMAAISILYGEWQYLIAAAGVPTGPYSRHTSFCGHAILSDEPVFVVPDACDDPRFAGNPVVAQDHLLRFYAGAPVLDEGRVPLGMLCVFDAHPRPALSYGEAAKLRLLAEAASARLQVLRTH